MLFLIFFFFTTEKTHNCNEIIWSENQKLQIEDFQGVVPDSTEYYALCSSGFAYSCVQMEDTLKIISYSVFFKKESWMKQKDSAVLKHEQGHFDVTEIFCRKFKKDILEIDSFNLLNYKSVLDTLLFKNRKANDRLQDKYDLEIKSSDETVYSEIQDKWTRIIQKSLKDSEQYKDSVIVLKLK